MPRAGPKREFVGVKLSPAGLAAIRDLAAKETVGNLSEMIRLLLSEAVAARRRARR